MCRQNDCASEQDRHGSGELNHESRGRSAADLDASHFDALWNRDVRIIDEANRRGDGTSTVGVADSGGWSDLDAAGRVYVKRQQAFFCRPPWNAFRRTPTLRRELRFLEAARALGVNVPGVALYREGSNDRALLVLFKNVGKTLAKLHSRRIMHGAVYPKHVLVEASTARVWMIDFEKSRRVASRSRAATRDIARLLRHAPFMTDADLEALVSAYDVRVFPDLLRRLKDSRPIPQS